MAREPVSARAPARIDLGGGWTDVPPYCDREGGYVCNVAIARYSTATVSEGVAPPSDRDERLIRAARDRRGVVGAGIAVTSDFPVGAGLGGSSAASAAIVGALGAWTNESGLAAGPASDADRTRVAELGRTIEVEDLGIAGGRQDHYAATYGGALGLTFTDSVAVHRIQLADATRREFEARGVLVYTGESRISGDTITAVLDAYRARERRVSVALARMKELAALMAAELAGGDLDDLGEMLREHWVFQRQLHPAIPTPLIDTIIARGAEAGSIGAKAMGASGGGCVFLLARAGAAEGVRRAVAPLGTVLDFAVDLDGLTRV